MDKRELCKQVGIRLVEVPYWWDRQEESLKSTIVLQNPDLLNEIFPQFHNLEDVLLKYPPVPSMKTPNKRKK